MDKRLEIITKVGPEITNVRWTFDTTINPLEQLAMLIITKNNLDKEIKKRLGHG